MLKNDATFLHFLEAHFERMQNEGDSLALLRQKAWKRFLALGLPERQDEAFRYVRLSDLYETSFPNSEAVAVTREEIAPAILPECRHSHVVFVGGRFCPHLSDVSQLEASVLLLPLGDAMRSHGHFLQTHWKRLWNEEKDPFAVLNFALHASGIFFYVPSRCAVANPVQCLHVAAEKSVAAPRIQIVCGAQSALRWVSTHLARTPHPHCTIPVTDLFLAEEAHVHFTNQLTTPYFCFDNLTAHLKQRAVLKTLTLFGGAKTVRHSAYIQLAKEGSEADLKGLWMLRGKEQAHAHVIVDHSAQHTRSTQLFKGILLDASQSSFEGKIWVRKEAQKTEAYQLNNNLILGRAAIAYSKPNLEIFADDVKASHGATITRPNAAQLFYLKSRGLSEDAAKQLLIAGFYQDILDQIPYAYVREQLNEVSL